ncbi:MAG TPA: hypothetical protein VHY91_25440 [Pirellulales bacterium]|jgi:hypothetical protein|nr:hypothetical protein [Pirellulales bacterium]HEX4146866.1 hypothetical protein [Pirellulales bacterium]
MSNDELPFPLDPVIEFYKKDVDRTLLVENLRLSVEDRLQNLQGMAEAFEALRRAGQELRARS